MYHDVYQFSVFPAASMRVRDGVAVGDDLSVDAPLILDDIYQFHPAHGHNDAVIDGNAIWLDNGDQISAGKQLTLMTSLGRQIEITLLKSVRDESHYIYVDGVLKPGDSYRLIAVDPINDADFATKLARGLVAADAIVTLADGQTRGARDLRAGDMLNANSRILATQQVIPDTPLLRLPRGLCGNSADIIVAPYQSIWTGGQILRADTIDGAEPSHRSTRRTLMIRLVCSTNGPATINSATLEAHLTDRRIPQAIKDAIVAKDRWAARYSV